MLYFINLYGYNQVYLQHIPCSGISLINSIINLANTSIKAAEEDLSHNLTKLNKLVSNVRKA